LEEDPINARAVILPLFSMKFHQWRINFYNAPDDFRFVAVVFRTVAHELASSFSHSAAWLKKVIVEFGHL
jgi:hypothetical protein